MPRLCGGVTVVVLGGLAVGCAAERPPQVVVHPTYSYLRDGGRFAAATGPATIRDSVEELATPLDLTEDAWLAPAMPRNELVRTSE